MLSQINLFQLTLKINLSNYLTQNKVQEDIFFLGGGSNVLFSKDYNGTIIHLSIRGKKIIEESDDKIIIEVSSGETGMNL